MRNVALLSILLTPACSISPRFDSVEQESYFMYDAAPPPPPAEPPIAEPDAAPPEELPLPPEEPAQEFCGCPYAANQIVVSSECNPYSEKDVCLARTCTVKEERPWGWEVKPPMPCGMLTPGAMPPQPTASACQCALQPGDVPTELDFCKGRDQYSCPDNRYGGCEVIDQNGAPDHRDCAWLPMTPPFPPMPTPMPPDQPVPPPYPDEYGCRCPLEPSIIAENNCYQPDEFACARATCAWFELPPPPDSELPPLPDALSYAGSDVSLPPLVPTMHYVNCEPPESQEWPQ